MQRLRVRKLRPSERAAQGRACAGESAASGVSEASRGLRQRAHPCRALSCCLLIRASERNVDEKPGQGVRLALSEPRSKRACPQPDSRFSEARMGARLGGRGVERTRSRREHAVGREGERSAGASAVGRNRERELPANQKREGSKEVRAKSGAAGAAVPGKAGLVRARR